MALSLGKKFYKSLNCTKIYDIEYWVYVFTGCWDYKSAQRRKIILYKIYQLVVVLLYFVSLVFFAIEAIIVRSDLGKLSFTLSTGFLFLVTIGKVCLFLKEKDSLEEVHYNLKNNLYLETVGVSLEDKNILRKKAEVLSSITIAFYTLMVLGLPLRVIADTSLGAYLIPIPNRESVESHYTVIYASEVVLIFHFLVVVLGHDLLVFAMLVRFIAHYEILEKNLHRIKELYSTRSQEPNLKGNSEDFKSLIKSYHLNRLSMSYLIKSDEIRENTAFELLKQNIKHHQLLLRQTENFSRLYSSPLLVQACGVGFLIATVILQILFISSQINILLVEQVIYVTTLLVNIFHFCTFATELTTKSIAAAEAMYDTPWYEMNMRNRRIVLIAIKKMLDGPKLKGGKMIVVNRITYLKFLSLPDVDEDEEKLKLLQWKNKKIYKCEKKDENSLSQPRI